MSKKLCYGCVGVLYSSNLVSPFGGNKVSVCDACYSNYRTRCIKIASKIKKPKLEFYPEDHIGHKTESPFTLLAAQSNTSFGH